MLDVDTPAGFEEPFLNLRRLYKRKNKSLKKGPDFPHGKSVENEFSEYKR
jgi:hypothetical protein